MHMATATLIVATGGLGVEIKRVAGGRNTDCQGEEPNFVALLRKTAPLSHRPNVRSPYDYA
jgi:hypothetical protein